MGEAVGNAPLAALPGTSKVVGHASHAGSTASASSSQPPFSLSYTIERPCKSLGALPRGFGNLPALALRSRRFLPGLCAIERESPVSKHLDARVRFLGPSSPFECSFFCPAVVAVFGRGSILLLLCDIVNWRSMRR